MARVIDRAAFFARVGYEPHREQLLYHNSRARFRIPVCGRRFGKSYMAGHELEPRLFVPGKMSWIVGPTYDLAEKEFRVVWDDLIIKMEMGRDKRIKRAYNKKQGNMYIEFPWQTRLEARALAVDTPIPTPNGWTTMQALRVGDWVFDEKGHPTQVTAATEVMYGHKCYEVIFKNGERLVADEGHQWLSYTAKSRYKGAPPSVLTTSEMLATWHSSQWPHQTNHATPLAAPVQYEEKKVLIDPYVYGAWLGDGSRTKAQMTIHPDDIGILEEFERLGYSYHAVSGKYAWAFDVPAGSHAMGGWLYSKTPIIDYLEGSIDQRLAMLQGLMDTDGGVEKYDVSFSNCDLEIVEAAEHLVWSLGWTSYRSTAKANGRNRAHDNYRVHFQPTLPVFRLKRKLDAQMKLRPRKSLYRYVKDIREVESAPVKCIQVDSESHLYLAGRNYIVTHNSADHPENLVGESLDHAIMSEAAKHKKATWERFIRPALTDRRGSADFPTTPEGFNWVHGLWQLGQNSNFPDFESWKFPSWANTVIYPGGRDDPEIKLLEATTTPEWFLQEIGADFASFVGKIFPEWDETLHVCNVEFRPDWPNYMVFDWGYTNPLAAVELQISPNDEVHIWREHYKSFTTLPDHIAILKNRDHPEGYHLDLAFGDPADPEAAATVSRDLVPCIAMPEVKSQFSWRDGIDLMRQFMKAIPQSTNPFDPDASLIVVDEFGTPAPDAPRYFVDHGCTNTIKEHNNYRSKEPIKGQNVPEFGTRQDDHILDAIRYGLVHIYKLGCLSRLSDVYKGQEWRPPREDQGSASGSLEPLTLDTGILQGGFGNMEGMEF